MYVKFALLLVGPSAFHRSNVMFNFIIIKIYHLSISIIGDQTHNKHGALID